MAEKHEYSGSGTKGRVGIYLGLAFLGIIFISFGMVIGFNPIVVGIGVLLIVVGLGSWMLSAGTKTLIISDISVKFMRGERLIFEAIWGEVRAVRMGTREADNVVILRFDFEGGRRVEISSDLDFPEETLEDAFYNIKGIKENYRYQRLEVLKGRVDGP